MTYRFWLLAHTVQNLSLKLSSGTIFCSACASLAPSMPMEAGSAGGGGGGGGAAAAACCLARSRGSAGASIFGGGGSWCGRWCGR